ncbi:hypothetical protein EJ07DRAFT_128674 [Lizonia empirigonia]|nr:hypothetical protein EJ07DRAFT_128674 [Lizonia empirigonia]
MSRHLRSTVHKTLLEISEQQRIPSRLLDTLEKHLIIFCTPYPRLPRSDSLRARRDVRSYYKKKRAQKVYVDMLDNAPQIFLPFILVVTPKACENLKAIDFYQMPTDGRRMKLRRGTKLVFDEIAEKNGLNDSPQYKKMIKVLFPEFARPITTAESGGYEYHLADVQNVRMVLGDRILDFLNSAPMGPGESRHETDCVGTCVPRNNFQDAIIYLRIGQARELAQILFPALRHQDITEIASAAGKFNVKAGIEQRPNVN